MASATQPSPAGSAAAGPPAGPVQVIDEDKQFSPEVGPYVSAAGLGEAGLGYHLISVFGSQSTGKSTLLNALFGTRFDVMDEARRRQTTKGIWMARAAAGELLVMDVEGTDGRERGEDQDFERKAALFALATSEVLLVNIWEHQVGLYQGANMGLLKTVFEVNVNLFHEATHRSMLLFVIRDHIGVTPLDDLAATLTADLERLWESLAKPPALDGVRFTDAFDVQFTALPHKVLQPEPFATAVRALHARFVDPADADYVFRPAYHRGVPADGWALYAQNVWAQIELNKDLDLPTQQVLVARFRCDEIATQAWDEFDGAVAPAEAAAAAAVAAGGVHDGFGAAASAARAAALDTFDRLASRYARSVYEPRRADLAARLDARLGKTHAAQLAALAKAAAAGFRRDVDAATGGAVGSYDFKAALAAADKAARAAFGAGAAAVAVAGTDALSAAADEAALGAALEEAAAGFRDAEAAKLSARAGRRLAAALDDALGAVFAARPPPTDLWKQVRAVFDADAAGAGAGLASLGLGPDALAAAQRRARAGAWHTLRGRLVERTKPDAVALWLRDVFEDRFRYDDKGVPRVWKPSDNIETVYESAREATLALVPLVAVYAVGGERVEPPDAVAAELARAGDDDVDFAVLLSPAQQLDVTSRFRRTADALYVDAKRSTIQSISQIPLYFYLLLLVLGWNEFMAVLKSPFYFTFLVLAGGLAYIAHQLNLWGPIITITETMSSQALSIAKVRLREALVTEPIAVAASVPSSAPASTPASRTPSRTTSAATSPLASPDRSRDIELDTLDHKGAAL
ncbi:RHD3/Sey1 [Dipodascopsis tothii]|uniref:RHD3/Sey1 n=1 Tax=Dipodascopsis tothii TaxID=44089 RepID=UPI0034CFCB80